LGVDIYTGGFLIVEPFFKAATFGEVAVLRFIIFGEAGLFIAL